MAGKVVSYVLRGDITQFTASMRAAAASTSKLADDLTGLDAKGAKARKGLTAIGDTAGKVGLVAAAGLSAIVVATANFDAKMSEVRAATGETAENMDALRQAAIDAGAATAFSASEAADGVTQLAKAGVSTADILGGGLAGALDLAAAGQIEVGEAAEYSAKAMTQFNLSGEDVTHVADLLAAAAGKAVGEVGDFGQALNQAGLVASQTGLTIEDTVGTLAAFAQAGLSGSDAGTAFKSMLQRLQNPLGQGAKTMTALGISAYDAQGNFVGITDVAEQLRVKLSELTPAQRDAAMAQMFGSDAVRAASILYKEGAEGIQGWIDKTNDSGFAAEQAAAKLDNLKGDWEAFMGSLETALIGSGEGSQGLFRSLVQGATDAVNAFNDLSPAAKNASTAMLAITAVTGGGLWLGAKVVQGISNTREALDNLGVSSDKTSRAMKGVAVAGAGLAALVAGAAAIRAIQSATDETLPSIERLTASLLDVSQAGLVSEFESIGESIKRVMDPSFFQGFGDMMQTPFEGLFGEAGTLRRAKAEIEALDAAFANIAAQGGVPKAMETFRQFAEAADLTVSEQRDLLAQMPQLDGAMASASTSAELAGAGQEQFADSMNEATSSAEAEAAALGKAVDAMREQRSEAIRAANAQINYQASLDDARESLKENGKTLDITTEKGRANKSALLAVASAWNDQSAAAKRAPGAHRAAITSFVNLATSMGMGEEKARALARRILELPDKRVKVTADTSQAEGAIDNVFAKLASLDGRQARAYVTTVYNEVFNRDAIGGIQRQASGGTVDGPRQPYGDKVLTMLAPGEEVISNRYGQADRHRDLLKAINAGRYADGGTVQRLAEGGTALPKDPERRADVLRLLIEIRDLRKDLAKTGKDALSGLERRRTEAELQATLRDLRETRGAGRAARRDALQERYDSIMAAMSGFDVSGALGRTNDPKNPTAAGVRSEIAEMRDALKEAGVAWSKEMRENARRMVRQARAIDVHERALERETKRREELTETLAEQQQAMEQLQQAMGSFSQQVAGNFLPDTFKGAYTVTEPGRVDPALQGRLSAAEQRLIALRSSPTGDSVAAAAEASRLLPQIEAMRAEIEQQSQPVERTVSALEAMREELAKNAEDATAFAEALRSLSASGLDPALFAELAASGDLGLAQELVKGGPAAVEDINDLWNQRAAAAAEVAAFATQQVYGEQQAALQKQIDAQSKLISAADKTIKALEGEVKVLGDRVERGAERGVKHVEQRLASIESAIKSLPRENRDNKRAGKGRG